MSDAEYMQNDGGLESSDASVRDAKYFAVIGYVSFLCFVPLMLQKTNPFSQFHGKQALMLFIVELAFCMVSLVPVLGVLVGTFGLIVCGIASLYAIYKVLTEEYWVMPVLGGMAEKINL